MDILAADYVAGRSCIQLTADLERGWKNLGKYWGFDKQIYLPYSRESKFRCRIRVAAHTTLACESYNFPSIEWDGKDGVHTFHIKDHRLRVIVPLNQPWTPTKLKSHNPCLYLEKVQRFDCEYSFRIWIVHHGPGQMFVKDEYEHGDGHALTGGRPESNRRRF